MYELHVHMGLPPLAFAMPHAFRGFRGRGWHFFFRLLALLLISGWHWLRVQDLQHARRQAPELACLAQRLLRSQQTPCMCIWLVAWYAPSIRHRRLRLRDRKTSQCRWWGAAARRTHACVCQRGLPQHVHGRCMLAVSNTHARIYRRLRWCCCSHSALLLAEHEQLLLDSLTRKAECLRGSLQMFSTRVTSFNGLYE